MFISADGTQSYFSVLAAGLQQAGAKLDPGTFERGLLTLPAFGGDRLHTKVQYGAGDYTGQADVRMTYWSTTRDLADQRQARRVPAAGRRSPARGRHLRPHRPDAAGPLMSRLPAWVKQVLAGLLVFVGAELVFGWGSRTTVLGFVPWPNGVPFGNLVEGAVFGLLYSLPAFGLILVYRAQRIINFAQAALGGTGAVLGLLLVTQTGLPYVVGLAVALLFSAVLGGLTERFVLTPFASKSRLILTVATIGIGQILVVGQIALPSLFGTSVLGLEPADHARSTGCASTSGR